MNKVGCIYIIENIINNKVYIGQTVNFKSRKYHHLYRLKHNKHYNKELQKDYNRYGCNYFIFKVIQDNINKKDLKLCETNWMNKYGGIDSCKIYNQEDISHYSKQAKENMCNSHHGQLSGAKNPMYNSKRFGAKNPMYGKHHSEKTKQIIGEKSKVAHKYRKYTLDFISNLREQRSKGVSLNQLSEKYNISISTLSTLINHGTLSK